ncbi:MAG: serine/threonine-protein phosphatase, partial [Bacteroidia bacterium]|nr:serine/threonine-protein phosphatase [Bacteroidia bacterium]
TGEFIYSIAGHAPPILCKNGDVEVLSKTHDPVLGIREHIYTDARITLTKNDTVFIYTDGITDAVDRTGRYYGTERLLSVLRKSDGPQTALDMVTEDLKNFTGDEKQMDDMTLLAFRPLPKAE